MSKKYEVTFSMFGSATIEADSPEEAREAASTELIEWSGFGTEFEDVQIDGVDDVEVLP